MSRTWSSADDPEKAEAIRNDPAFQLLLRTQLDRETDLLGQRTAWVMASQAFLFSAYAIAVNAHVDAAARREGTHDLLIAVIPWISLLSLILLMVTIAGGLFALIRFRSFLLAHADVRVRALDPGPVARAAGLAAPLLVPLVFLVAWVILLVHPSRGS
jgi:hypothetical protein